MREVESERWTHLEQIRSTSQKIGVREPRSGNGTFGIVRVQGLVGRLSSVSLLARVLAHRVRVGVAVEMVGVGIHSFLVRVVVVASLVVSLAGLAVRDNGGRRTGVGHVLCRRAQRRS